MAAGDLPSPYLHSRLHRTESQGSVAPAMVDISITSPNDTVPVGFNVAGHARSPGITTVPGIDPPLAGRSASYAVRCARTLGNTTLLETEIDELFRM